MSGLTVHARIVAHLQGLGIAYTGHSHDALRSTAHAAELRGLPLSVGGKALVMKGGGRFLIASFRASDRLDSRALRRALGVSKLRFATREELLALTGLVPGCVPPFGPPIFELPLYADRRLALGDQVAFTPGQLTESVVLTAEDWVRAAQPELVDIVV